MNASITKSRLKELVKEVMVEESEYQAFFQKALDKAGKDINAMSDEEKKAFFNKIDSAWNGKGEKNEGNAFGAAVSKAKEEGDDSFEVDGEEYKVESVSTELPTATIPSGIKMKLSQAIDKIKDAKLNPTQKLQLLAQIVDSLGMDKSQLGTITSKIKSKMESVNEDIKDWDVVNNVFVKFLKANTKELEKRVLSKDEDATKKAIDSIISGLTNAQRSLKLK
jgi:hypothetical protein